MSGGPRGSGAPLVLLDPSSAEVEPTSPVVDAGDPPPLVVGIGASEVEPVEAVADDGSGGALYEVKPSSPGAVHAGTPRVTTIEKLREARRFIMMLSDNCARDSGYQSTGHPAAQGRRVEINF